MSIPGNQARTVLASIRHDSATTRRPICLESGPLIDYIASLEPVTSLIESLIEDVLCTIVISTVTLAEVVARPAQSGDVDRVRQIEAELVRASQIAVVPFDREHSIQAALVRGQTQLKLPDAAIVATAQLANAIALIGNDRQWRHKPLGVPFYYLDDLLNEP